MEVVDGAEVGVVGSEFNDDDLVLCKHIARKYSSNDNVDLLDDLGHNFYLSSLAKRTTLAKIKQIDVLNMASVFPSREQSRESLSVMLGLMDINQIAKEEFEYTCPVNACALTNTSHMRIRVEVCGHVFCVTCLPQALVMKNRCPICERGSPIYWT